MCKLAKLELLEMIQTKGKKMQIWEKNKNACLVMIALGFFSVRVGVHNWKRKHVPNKP